ncbi:MAG: hypothetical protein K0S74_1128 [Chlamydiales bacterium]|jgi:ribosome-associated translation inhibitor RaiA|nr:hypothetical protein [Chlamydiales bacterium]
MHQLNVSDSSSNFPMTYAKKSIAKNNKCDNEVAKALKIKEEQEKIFQTDCSARFERTILKIKERMDTKQKEIEEKFAKMEEQMTKAQVAAADFFAELDRLTRSTEAPKST